MWSSWWDMHASLWNDAAGGKHKQMFATKHVQILPPSFTARPPPLSRKPQPHMWHITKEAENMFLELNYYKPSKQDKFPNWLLSQHLLITSFFFMGNWYCWFAGCQIKVSHGGEGYDKQPGGESRRGRTTLGRVDIRSKTNSLTSKPWQTLLTGSSVSQLSSQMPFKPFFFFSTAFGVCFINPSEE